MKENDTKKPETPPVTAEDVRNVYGCLIVPAVSLLLLSVGGMAAEITVIAVNIHLYPPFIPLCFAVVLPVSCLIVVGLVIYIVFLCRRRDEEYKRVYYELLAEKDAELAAGGEEQAPDEERADGEESGSAQ